MPTYAEGFRRRLGNVSRAIGRRTSIISNMFRGTRRNTNRNTENRTRGRSINPVVKRTISLNNPVNGSRPANSIRYVSASKQPNVSKQPNAFGENMDKESSLAIRKIIHNFEQLNKTNIYLERLTKNNKNPKKNIDKIVKALFPTDKRDSSSYLNNTTSKYFLNFVLIHKTHIPGEEDEVPISLQWDEFIEHIKRLIPLNYISNDSDIDDLAIEQFDDSGIKHIEYFCNYWMKKLNKPKPKTKKLRPTQNFENWLLGKCEELLSVIAEKELEEFKDAYPAKNIVEPI